MIDPRTRSDRQAGFRHQLNLLHRLVTAAPSTGDLLDDLGENLLVLDAALATNAVVMEGAGAAGDDQVEAGEIATSPAPVPRYVHTTYATTMVHAFVLIEAEPARIADLAEALTEVDGVSEAYSVSGEVADLVAIVRVRQHDDLAEVVTRRIAGLPGILATSTLVAFKAYSRHDLEAIWDLGPR